MSKLRAGAKLALKHTTRSARVIVDKIDYRVDVNTLAHDHNVSELKLNEVARVRLRASSPLVVDPYARNRTTGSFILIDETSNNTVAAGMITAGR